MKQELSSADACRGTARRVLSLVTIKVTFRLPQGHSYSCNSISHTWFSISLPLQANCLYLAPFSRYSRLFPKISRVTWTWPRPLGGKTWSSSQNYKFNRPTTYNTCVQNLTKLTAVLFDTTHAISYTCLVVTKSLSRAVFEIMGLKDIGITTLTFHSHVTSSMTSSFDPP